MSFVIAGNSASTGYNLTRSLRFRASASASLSRTPASTTNQKTYTYSLWFKRGTLGTSQSLLNAYYGGSSRYSMALINSSDVLEVFSGIYSTGGSTTTSYYYVTTQVFRDPSAWYHLVVAVDTTQATAANRVKIYVNGSQVTAFSTSTTPAQNADGYFNVTTTQNNIGQQGSTAYFDGYLTEVNFIDGQALTPSSFGSTNALTGVWQPAKYSGSYGTNGFYLPFTDNSALTTASNVGLGKDFSGNANYWVTNNISITAGVTYDSMTDVPTLTSATAANFAVLNPLDYSNGAPINGNLVLSNSASTNYYGARATFGLSSGKWYWEQTIVTLSTQNASNAQIDGGVCLSTYTLSSGIGSAGCWGFQNSNGSATNSWKFDNGTGTNSFTIFGAGDIAGFALDMGAGTLAVYRNNTLQFTCSTSLAGNTVFPVGWAYAASGQSASCAINFGQQPFTYTAPTGFVALNTYNLPTSTIVKGNTVMDATLYTGNSSTQTVTNAGAFKPDLVWIKNRSTASQHVLTDSVRGITKQLFSSNTNAEQTSATGITALNSNGFSLDTNVSPTGSTNSSPDSYVGWQWQAGQGSSSSNTSGTITSTVSVNASAGFSVVTWTGTGANATVGHGLGVAPQLIINKPRNAADNWISWHTSLGSTGYIYLNLTNASTTLAAMWNSTLPTSSVFSVGTNSNINTSAQTMVSYCWTPIAGFSAFGSYTGNGSTDGVFVYTGFRPKFIMTKVSSSTGAWLMHDTTRDPYNVSNLELQANDSGAEYNTNTAGAGDRFDILSNGFKNRSSNSGANYSGYTYIYMAFAENPFRNALAR